MQDITKIDVNAPTKPTMVLDVNSSYLKNDSYSYARNATYATHFGDLGIIAEEQRLRLIVTCPYKIIGTVTLPNNKFLIFSTDNTKSEIGIFDEKLGVYSKVYNPTTFGFNTSHPPIVGEAKKNFDQKTIVVFGNVKIPLRRIILEDLHFLKDEETTLFFKHIKVPTIDVTKSNIGNLPNGSYSFAVAYTVDNTKFSDYYSVTKREQIFSEIGGKGFTLTISNLDREFDKYQLVMIANINGIITAQIIGNYSTRIGQVTVTDFNTETAQTISLETLVIKNKTWRSAGIIASNANYLLLGDLVKRKEISIQHLLWNVKGEYVVEQIELDQYERNLDEVGFYRDEVYDFYVEGLYNTGEFTNKFHILGPKPKKDDLSKVGGDDVFEYDNQFVDCLAPDKLLNYQVYNTAGTFIRKNNKFVCGRRFLGYGDLGFWQSTVPYPDNEYQFGENANTPIRYFKMPDEAIVPRYEVINGKYYVNVIGVRFSNLPDLSKIDSDIVGFRITRSKTDKTIVARGMFTNVRGYTDNITNTEVLYTNYGVNPLGVDPYISSTQTAYKKKKETNYKGLDRVYQDKLNFFSPHMYFNEKYILGPEVKIESIETGSIKGKFENVHGHPKHKLLSNTAFWIASMIGVIEAALVILGEQRLASTTELRIGAAGGTNNVSQTNIQIRNIDDLMQLNLLTLTTHIVNSVRALDVVSLANIIPLLIQAVALVASLGIKVTYAALKGSIYANELLDSIQKILGFTDYTKQFNGVAKFNAHYSPSRGNIRRRALYQPEYLSPDLLSIREFTYQNFQRETSALFELNKSIEVPRVQDQSLFTITSAKIDKKPESEVERPISAYYGTSKVSKPSQYGPLGSSETIVMHNDILSGTSTPSLFGGDCVIGRFSVMKKMRFFRQDMTTEFGNELPPNFPDGTEYNYLLYPNLAYPRYWADYTKYDYSQLLRRNVTNKTNFARTTSSKHNLDNIKNDDGNLFRIDNAYFYLYHNTVMEFICEADYNINFREKGKNRHYSKTNNNLSVIFRPQIAQFPEEFLLNKAYYNIYANEVFAEQIRDTFTPETAFPENQPNSVIYSLPSFNLQSIDNWQYMLPLNFWNFGEGSFGKLSGIHKLEQDALVFTFTNSSPLILPGKDVLQLDGTGRKITIGDNGLFVQDPRETLPTDTNHGHSNSRYAFKSTHLGRYYPSEDSGLIFNFTGIPQDITQEGIYFWAKKYMPIQLLEHFPSYENSDNPISGCGYLLGFDPTYKLIYITKRDFLPLVDNLTLENGVFKYQGTETSLRNSKHFEDISWTLSYSPENKGFVSFHDWHPDWVIQSNNHLYTVKDNQIWKHNDDYEGFSNVYGKDVPFEIEFITSSPVREILRSIEYIVEGYKYKNKGRNRFHEFGENFDRMIVSNSEQISPILDLVYATNDPETNLDWPKYKGNNIFEILYTKEEGKYRINQFWDATKDRGEFTNAEFHLRVTGPSGYKITLNSKAIDPNKPEEQRKKFRHEYHYVWMQKLKSSDVQLIVKMFNFKKTISLR